MLGVRLGVSIGANSPGARYAGRLGITLDEVQWYEHFLARWLFSWIRASTRTEAAGKVTKFDDRVALVSEGAVAPNARSVDPAHALSQGNSGLQAAAVTTASELNGREVAPFRVASTSRYQSTIPAANWRFPHAGPCQIWSVGVVRSTTGTRIIHSTGNVTNATNHHVYHGPANMNAVIYVGVSGPLVFKTGLASGMPWLSEFRHDASLNPNRSFRFGTDAAFTGNYSTAPSSVDPVSAFGIGDNMPSQGLYLNDDLAEVAVANNVSQSLQTAYRRYASLRYGQAWQ